MSCRVDEHQLALYVEGDLDDRDARSLDDHLDACDTCRAVRRDLERSQSRLKSLSGLPLDENALALVRTRVLDAVDQREPSRGRVPVWGWALAASVAVLATTGLLLRQPAVDLLSQPPPVAQSPAPSASPESLERLAELPGEGPEPLRRQAIAHLVRPPRSTVAPSPSVSQTEEAPETVTRLSPEDADQLARALVFLSQIEELPDTLDDTKPERDETDLTLVRLTTADPDIVIYWQMDANGG